MQREMKDSGIKWVGEIPQKWNVQKVKHVCQVRGEKNKPEAQVLSLYRELGVVIKADRDDNHNVTSEDTSNYKYVMPTDIVVNKMKAWQGSIGVSEYEGIVSPAYYVFKLNTSDLYPRYIHYLLRDKSFVPEYRRLSGGIRVGQWDLSLDNFKQIPVLIPPVDEQQRIAMYLDSQCADIDNVIEKTRTSIEEYKKLKRAVITQAVTKGVREERPMKDSGNEWIGDIPKEWGCCKSIYCLKMPITDGPHTTPEFFDSGVPFISAEAVSCGNGKIDFSHMRGYISREFYEECCKKYIPQIDDIFMIKSGATTGRVSIVDTEEEFTIWSPLAVFRCDTKVMNPLFLFYFLQSEGFQKQVENGWSYGTQQNIGMRVLEKLKVCRPAIDEQLEIVKYLKNKVAEVDVLILKKEQLLIEIENYKKSLIYECVTGKREV